MRIFPSNNSRRQQLQFLQQIERGNFSPGSSPSGMDARDLFDCHIGQLHFFPLLDSSCGYGFIRAQSLGT